MSIKLQIGYCLSTLPNQNGFIFSGVTKNGDLIPCVVKRAENSKHYVEHNGKRIYAHLQGWVQYLPKFHEDIQIAHGIKGEE